MRSGCDTTAWLIFFPFRSLCENTPAAAPAAAAAAAPAPAPTGLRALLASVSVGCRSTPHQSNTMRAGQEVECKKKIKHA